MFNMVNISHSVIFINWKGNLLAVSSDSGRSITGRYQGVVTFLENPSTNMLVQVWYVAHHLDLVMEYIFSIVVKYHFYSVMTSFI